MPGADRTLAFADGRPVPALVVAGGLIIGLATLAGAWLARRPGARRELCLGAGTGALLVIAGLHLLPDAWSGAEQARIFVWAIPAVALVSFALAGLAVRSGCTCQGGREAAGGAGTAMAMPAGSEPWMQPTTRARRGLSGSPSWIAMISRCRTE